MRRNHETVLLSPVARRGDKGSQNSIRFCPADLDFVRVWEGVKRFL